MAQDHPAIEIHNLDVVADERRNLVSRAQRGEPAITDRKRLGPRFLAIDRLDPRIRVDGIGGSIGFSARREDIQGRRENGCRKQPWGNEYLHL